MAKNIEIQELSPEAMKQYINARQLFNVYSDVSSQAREYQGSMIWRQQSGRTYLIRTSANSSQRSLGPRTDETEAMFHEFMKSKKFVEARRKDLRLKLEQTRRMNKALYVGNVDNTLISILSALTSSELANSLTVIGASALHAYEAATGAYVVPPSLSSQDIDCSWHSQKKLTIGTKEPFTGHTLMEILQRVDKSFELRDAQPCLTAVNTKGFEVVLSQSDDDGELIGTERDFWKTPIRNINWLLKAPQFNAVIVGKNGKMAHMNTVDPRAFVLFNLWCAKNELLNAFGSAQNDVQTKIVARLIQDRMPQLSTEGFKVFLSETKHLFEPNRLLVDKFSSHRQRR